MLCSFSNTILIMSMLALCVICSYSRTLQELLAWLMNLCSSKHKRFIIGLRSAAFFLLTVSHKCLHKPREKSEHLPTCCQKVT